jgi:hypothetical protein
MKDDWRQNSKKNFKNLTPGATKNSLNVTKKIIKKAFLEQNLLNFKNVPVFKLNFLLLIVI